ncbi:siderophore-interacting protein [Ilumatobacter sp.]|uniref:siderophore-interacting protein n=1 Tax=Ilumatobacter sp. TaxID=1967498 RepID=UPI003B51CDEC
MASAADLAKLRTPPPDFGRVTVRSIDALTPHLRRVVLGGDALDGFEIESPAASVRILVPEPGADELVLPEWQGNEFRYADGERPSIRTFTPRSFDPEGLELTIDVVEHSGGVVSSWARAASPGDQAAFSGPGRGFALDPETSGYLLAGDETALPAIAQLVEWIPDDVPIRAIVEVRDGDARLLGLDDAPHVEVDWVLTGDERGSEVLDRLGAAEIDGGTAVWVAGEAAVMHAVRSLLRDERGIERARMTVRGYWKDRR